jgi:hypothetical protein
LPLYFNTSHHLAFTNKNYRGYAAMKEKMAQFSEKTDEGIPLLEFAAPGDSPQFGMFATPTNVSTAILSMEHQCTQSRYFADISR